MSMSTHVSGFKPPDEKWKKMKEVYDSCVAGDVRPPKEVMDFFGHEEPDEAGVSVGQDELEKCGAVREHNEEMTSGYEVLIDKLPKDVKIIRFSNSW